MEPYNAKTMPIDYPIDKEMLKLIYEANAKYGEYKSLLNTLEFDAGFFLNSVIVNESYKSTQIEGTQVEFICKCNQRNPSMQQDLCQVYLEPW